MGRWLEAGASMTHWLPWALLSAAFAALTAIFAKAGVQTIDPNYATFIRTLVILVFAGAIVALTSGFQTDQPLPARAWVFLILSGLATGASWLCYFRALSLGQAAQVAPVEKISVVLVAIFGVAFLGEHLSPRAWLGVALITSGVILIALKSA
jgi:transporter family protein